MAINKMAKNILLFFLFVIIFALLTSISNSGDVEYTIATWNINNDPFWNFSMSSKIASRLLAI